MRRFYSLTWILVALLAAITLGACAYGSAAGVIGSILALLVGAAYAFGVGSQSGCGTETIHPCLSMRPPVTGTGAGTGTGTGTGAGTGTGTGTGAALLPEEAADEPESTDVDRRAIIERLKQRLPADVVARIEKAGKEE